MGYCKRLINPPLIKPAGTVGTVVRAAPVIRSFVHREVHDVNNKSIMDATLI